MYGIGYKLINLEIKYNRSIMLNAEKYGAVKFNLGLFEQE